MREAERREAAAATEYASSFRITKKKLIRKHLKKWILIIGLES